MKNLKENNKILKIKYFLYIFIPFFSLSFFYFITIRKHYINNEIKQLKTSEKTSIKAACDITSNNLSGIVSDLLYLSQNTHLHQSIINFQGNFYETSEEYINFLKYQKKYDQIRYIDETGMEIIRVNYNDGNPTTVDNSHLQNKSDRHYFKNTVNLNKNEVFISNFDLNIENGKIETPYKPMIRFSTPVFDFNGKKIGIVIANYLGKNILEKIKNQNDPNRGKSYFILNENSYYLSNIEKEKEWGFMFEEKKSVNFKNDYPELWEKIKNSPRGQLFYKGSLFTYLNIYPGENENIYSENYHWIVISKIHKNFILQLKSNINRNLFSKFLSLLIFIIFISIFYSKLKYDEYLNLKMIKYKNLELMEKNIKIKNQKKNLEKFNDILAEKNRQLFLSSTVDPLTQVYSRGHLSELFSKEFTKSKRYSTDLSCVIFDVDHFKSVNDTYGHLVGDYLLTAVSDIVKANIRNEDIFGRYGGDEFLIIFPSTSLNNSKIAAEKIRKAISDETFIFNEKIIKITVSMGVSAINDSINNIEEMINNSDSALYRAKESGRNRVDIYNI